MLMLHVKYRISLRLGACRFDCGAKHDVGNSASWTRCCKLSALSMSKSGLSNFTQTINLRGAWVNSKFLAETTIRQDLFIIWMCVSSHLVSNICDKFTSCAINLVMSMFTFCVHVHVLRL